MAPAAQLLDVSVRYELFQHSKLSLKEYFIGSIRRRTERRHIEALNEVNLRFEPGTCVGVVGANGAGKSTLLKVVARTLRPTTGKVTVSGRVAPILELGTGFDPELTGRENILLNALLLGRSKKEISAAQDGIISFTDLGDRIDSAVKTYSTGMVARLGFAIATAWAPDLLILDEVLTVGDAAFQQKAEERIDSLIASGCCCLLTSHAPATILDRCQRALWIEAGRVIEDGDPVKVVERYTKAILQSSGR